MRRFYMLVGLPATGKTTYRNALITHHSVHFKWKVISIDDIIERIAKEKNKTYNEVWTDNINFASQEAMQETQSAIENGYDVIWDATNLTRSSRAKKLNFVPDTYQKFAVVFIAPKEEEYKKRLNSRPGKNIPESAIISMQKSFEYPQYDEGFQEIIEI